jgi:hypothetical protein
MAAVNPSADRERFVVDIPRPLYDTASRYASRADLNMTHYFRIGHRVLYGLAANGAFRSNDNMVDMGGIRRPLPLNGLLPDLAVTPAQEAPKKLVMALPAAVIKQTEQLIQASPIKTRTAYAINNLNLINGLVAMRDTIDETRELSFGIISAEDGRETPAAQYLLLEL